MSVSSQNDNDKSKGITMKKNILFGALILTASSLLAADSPKDEVTSAAKKLGDKPNYSWKTTTVVPEGTQFRPGPVEGKTEKDGFTMLTMTFGENTSQAVLKGDKAALTNRTADGSRWLIWKMKKAPGASGPCVSATRKFRPCKPRNWRRARRS
jgi:hypothetical protein